MDAQGFVFLSHNSADKPAVEEIAQRLQAEGIEPWVDAWHLVPGEKWQPALEKALGDVRASVIFVGPSGIGPWQDEEMRVAIDRRVGDPGFRVVPVLLPGAQRGKRSAVPPFLSNVTWVEFQHTLAEESPFRRLIAGIEGKPPGQPAEIIVAGTNPYRGLQVFDVADCGLFFGREALTGWLVSDLQASLITRGEARLLAIVGASGSGKSSLARAGLIAALRAGAIEGSQDWRYTILKPGGDPLESLASAGSKDLGLADAKAILKFQDDLGDDTRILHAQAALAMRGTPTSTRLVLLVDQFEEIFTLCPSEERRRAFIDNLLHAAAVANGPTVVVLTLRADFLGKCAAHERLATMLSDHQELVGPMGRDELRQAIERPAWQSGCEFQAGLADVLLDDVAAQPGALPLLQHALFELWRQREGRWLTHQAYERIGKVQGALARRADEVYQSFTPEEQAAVRQILLRLTQPGEGTEDTRRRAPLAEIIPSAEARPTIERVVGRLADERLLVTEGDSVDVAHEALIRGWPTLRDWLDQDREGLREHRRLTLAAAEWERLGRDPSAYFRGLRLEQVLAWREKNEAALNPLEREFVDAGVRLRDDERARELGQLKRQRKLTRFALLGAFVAVISALVAGVFWWRSDIQRTAAEVQRALADTRRLATESQLELNRRFDLGLLLATAATQIAPSWEARNSLLAGIQSHPYLAGYLASHKDAVNRVAFSPDGKTLASASRDGTVILWDVAARSPLGEPLAGHKGAVFGVAFSPDGKRLASASRDGTVILWDVAARSPLGEPLVGHKDAVFGVAFSPDGKRLASASADGTVILWDLTARKTLGELVVGHKDSVNAIAFSPDGKMLASASSDTTAMLWDVTTRKPLGKPLVGQKDLITFVAFSPDGKTLALVSANATVILWDVAARKPLGELPAGQFVLCAAFSPDGKTLASASRDKTVVLWDVAARKPVGEPLAGHRDWVYGVAFSPDGKTLASAGADKTVVLWDLSARKPLGKPLAGHKDWVRAIALSPDGKTLASGSDDKTVILWDVAARKPLGEPLAGHTSTVTSVAFSPDGKTLASASFDKTVILWDVGARKPVGEPLAGHKDEVTSVAFNPDGKTLASASRDKTLILWDLSARKPVGELLVGDKGRVCSIAFSPDGKTLGSGCEDGTVILWDVTTRKPLSEAFAGKWESVSSIAFSPDGKTLASASDDNTVVLWDVAARKPVGELLVGNEDRLISIAFSPDGRTLASSGDGMVILWDVAARKRLGEPLAGHEDWVFDVTFSPDGKALASTSADGTVMLWDVALESWRDQACGIANRNLSCDEWRNYMGERPYRKVCEKFPEPQCSSSGL